MTLNLNLSATLQGLYDQIDTPFLLVNKPQFLANLAQLKSKTEALGSRLRPHFKTVRSLDAVEYLLTDQHSPITVSTVKEAEALASRGYKNMVYAVGISASKLPRIHQLLLQGVRIIVLLDSAEQALTLNQYCLAHDCAIEALVEVDCDGHRGGIRPEDPLLVAIATALHQGAAAFAGILIHAGESYHCIDHASLQRSADNEVNKARLAVALLNRSDIPCGIVSIGSTPTAQRYQELDGITEVRAGVYSFFDLVMAGIGVCQYSDIAASVVATVIGHNEEKGWVLIDAGWMALSSDRGTAEQPHDCGYGLVIDPTGTLTTGIQVSQANQEHGIVEGVNGMKLDFAQFPIGSRLRILPNHACATAAMHKQYQVFDHEDDSHSVWQRVQGW